MAAMADDRFCEILQCVAALHSAGLGDGEEAGGGHLSLSAAIAKGNSSGTPIDFAGQISPNRLLYGG